MRSGTSRQRHLLASGDLQRQLNLLDPYKIWTWDPSERRPYRGYPKKQLPMWHRYRVELYPHYGRGTGILDALHVTLRSAVEQPLPPGTSEEPASTT